MKQLLSNFVNLFYLRPEGESWKWSEIVLVLGMIAFLVFITVMAAS